MSHVRKQIRDKAETALTGLTTTGANVFPSRVHPFHNSGSELPGLALYTTDEEVANDEGDDISHIQKRFTLLIVEGYVAAVGSDNVDDTMDKIAAEVETAIFADQFLGGIVHGIDLVGTESGLSDEAETPVGVVRLVFRVFYLTAEGAPETNL